MTADPPENVPPRFGPANEPSPGTVAAFERRYVLAVALGLDPSGDGRFLAIWRRLVSLELQARIGFGQLTTDWRDLVPTDEEREAAAIWAALETPWPPT